MFCAAECSDFSIMFGAHREFIYEEKLLRKKILKMRSLKSSPEVVSNLETTN